MTTTSKTIKHTLVTERTETILRAIKSGVNDCNTLMCGGKLNEDFVRSSIRPTIAVCVDESDCLRQDNAAIRESAELARFTLEYVASNVPNADLLIAQAREMYVTRQKKANIANN